MSATGRTKKAAGKSKRRTRPKRSNGTGAADFCPTPIGLARAIVACLPIRPTDVVIEPSAGKGSFLHALAEVHDYRHAIAVERYADRYPELAHAPHGELVTGRWEDYRRPESADWIVGNPPFNAAQDHLAYAMLTLKPGGHLVYLLRQGFTTTSGRNAELSAACTPWRRWEVVGRPSFYGGGSDGSEYTVFVWRKGLRNDHDTISRDLRWKNNDEHRRHPELNPGTIELIRARDWAVTDYDWPPIPAP